MCVGGRGGGGGGEKKPLYSDNDASGLFFLHQGNYL